MGNQLGKNLSSDVQSRINQVQNWHLAGLDRAEIIHKGIEKFGVSRSQVYAYYERMVKDTRASLHAKAGNIFEDIVARAWFLYKANMSIRDFKAALQVLKFIAELYQVYQPPDAGGITININTLRMMDSQVREIKANYDPHVLAETAPHLIQLMDGDWTGE